MPTWDPVASPPLEHFPSKGARNKFLHEWDRPVFLAQLRLPPHTPLGDPRPRPVQLLSCLCSKLEAVVRRPN